MSESIRQKIIKCSSIDELHGVLDEHDKQLAYDGGLIVDHVELIEEANRLSEHLEDNPAPVEYPCADLYRQNFVPGPLANTW